MSKQNCPALKRQEDLDSNKNHITFAPEKDKKVNDLTIATDQRVQFSEIPQLEIPMADYGNLHFSDATPQFAQRYRTSCQDVISFHRGFQFSFQQNNLLLSEKPAEHQQSLVYQVNSGPGSLNWKGLSAHTFHQPEMRDDVSLTEYEIPEEDLLSSKLRKATSFCSESPHNSNLPLMGRLGMRSPFTVRPSSMELKSYSMKKSKEIPNSEQDWDTKETLTGDCAFNVQLAEEALIFDNHRKVEGEGHSTYE